MAIKTSAIHGNEQSGIEETEIRAVEATARFSRTATAIGGAAVRAGVGKVREALRKRQERLATAPELRGNLYNDYREAFISRGVPEEIAKEAAAGLVQNESAEDNEAIATANRIVSEGQFQNNARESDQDNNETKTSAKCDQTTQQPIATASTAMAALPRLVEQTEEQPSQTNSDEEMSSLESAVEISRQVAFEKPPSEMKWQELQKVSSKIKEETGQKPASNKKVDVHQFVEKYWNEQNQERTELSQTLSVSGLEESYRSGLEAENVESTTAASAARDLVTGKDANSSPVIAHANSQIKKPRPERSPLQQMYYDVLAKQKAISPELTELASKDLAAGKGAHSSKHVRAAHDTILNRELAKSGLDPHRQNWFKYGRHITQQDPAKRDRIIAAAALRDGVSAKSARAMIRWNSPIAAEINQQQGSTAMANYADNVVSQVKVRATTKQMATGKIPAPVKKQQSKGVEI
ncbi:MAG: hypothetical protein AAGE59_04245 [Cyanobacteria bacterium P01_F01_bin.86]